MEAKQTNPDNAILTAALEHIKNGRSILPIRPDGSKKPCLDSWKEFQSRFPTEAEVREWWVRWPGAWVAMITGQISGVTLIDCDTYELPGCDQEIETRLHDSDMPAILNTLHGGRNFAFAYTSEIKQSQDHPGIHTRNDGGYAVLPPSPGYTWEIELGPKEALCPVPQEIIEFIRQLNSKNKTSQTEPLPGSFDVGQYLDLHGVLFSVKAELDRTIYRLKRCPFTENHTDKNDPTGSAIIQGSNGIVTFHCKHTSCANKKWEDARRAISGDDSLGGFWTGELPEQPNPKEPVKFCDVSFTPREHIIKGFPLDRKLLYVHSAEGGGLKSFNELHLIKCILARSPLFGKYEILLSGPVLLFDEETPEPILEERLNGFGLKNKDFEGYLFHFSNLKIDREDDLQTFLYMVEKYHPVLCAFDSLTRFHGAEENSNSEMKRVMMNFRKITEMGPMAWIVHHVAKESKMTRGAAEIVNAADVEFRSSIDKEGLMTLQTGKVRIEQPEPIILKPVFTPGKFDMVYQMTQGAQLWEQVHSVLTARGEPVTVVEIQKELEKQETKVSDKVVRGVLEAKIKAGVVTGEKLPGVVTRKNGSTYERRVWHFSL